MRVESWEDVWSSQAPSVSTVDTAPESDIKPTVSARAAAVVHDEERIRAILQQWQEETARRSATVFVAGMICFSVLALYVDSTRREVTRLRQMVAETRRR